MHIVFVSYFKNFTSFSSFLDMYVPFFRHFLAFLLLIIVENSLVSSFGRSGRNQSILCSLCHGITRNCTKGESHDGRCCVDHRNTIIGLDLSYCNLTTLPSLESVKHVERLLLENNSKLDCSSGSFHNSFEGLTNLSELVLPSRCNCVGGIDVWQSSFNRSGAKWCLHQMNPCKQLNFTCPDNSYCLPNGPGLTECLCSPGWFGYRCLIKHGFPFIEVFVSMVTVTLVIILFLVFLQRKRRKTTSVGYSWLPGVGGGRDIM